MDSHSLLNAAADLILGASCAGCGHPGLGACTGCRSVLQQRAPFWVPGLAAQLPVVAAGDYGGVLRPVLIAAKERQALGLLPLLGDRLAAAVAAGVLASGSTATLVLVPIPTHPRQIAIRGVDLPESLALLAARRLRRTGLSVRLWRGLRTARAGPDQAELGRSQRLVNRRGAFAVRGTLPSARMVIVDDIVTTGSTLAEAARVLRQGGAIPGWAATVAATPLRNGARGA